jgi:hypothetical protein
MTLDMDEEDVREEKYELILVPQSGVVGCPAIRYVM